MPAQVGALAPLTSAAPKRADPFYQSKEWRAARDLCVTLHNFTCARSECGRRHIRLFVDHIIELKDGGAPFDQSNLEPLCGACHTRKTGAVRFERHRGAPTRTAGRPGAKGGGGFVLA